MGDNLPAIRRQAHVQERRLGKDRLHVQERRFEAEFAKLAREMGCDYRTVKKAYESAQDPDSPPDPPSRKARPRKVDPHLATIREKVEAGCSYVSIFKFIKETEGYEGCLTSVKYECERVAGERLLGRR